MQPSEIKAGMPVYHKDGFSGIATGKTRSYFGRNPEEDKKLFIIIKQDGSDYGAYAKNLTPYKKLEVQIR